MGLWLSIEFWLLALLSTWMTATAISIFKGQKQLEEEMENLYGQVYGSVRSGDLPRAILLLEGEPGPLASLLSSILTEATKFTPKLRVAYKVTLESMKRRSQVRMNPLRVVSLFAPALGVLGFLSPLIALMTGSPSAWMHALWLCVCGFAIGLISYGILAIAERRNRQDMEDVGEYGRKLLGYLLSPESPLQTLRGQSFPAPQ